MANDFKVGDVVQLKSGSMPMTVIAVKNNEIWCKWFNFPKDFPPNFSTGSTVRYYGHQVGEDFFPPDALEKTK